MDPFEEYVKTKYTDETCDSPQQIICEVDACRCVKGYVRHEGKCIRKCDCREYFVPYIHILRDNLHISKLNRVISDFNFLAPKCKGANEIYIYTQTEDLTCNGEEALLCAPVEACRCRNGYVRHQGVCIKYCDCREYNLAFILS